MVGAAKTVKSLQGSIVSRNKNLAKNNVFYKIGASKILRTQDSIRLCHLLLQVDDSISLLKKSFYTIAQYVGNMDTSIISKMQKYIELTANVNQLASNKLNARMGFFDDLDHEIIPAREYLLLYKQHCDSFLFINDTSIVKYFSVKY